MEVIIKENKQAAEETAAKIIAYEMSLKKNLVLGLATGRTVESVYSHLVDIHNTGEIDFTDVSTFNLDEYVGLSGDHDQSYRYYMNHHLFSKVNIKTENTHLPSGIAEDVEEECAEYERKIEALGGIDLQLLGIGTNGHIGFNEPGSSFRSRTRIKTLTRATVEQNGPIFGDESLVPRHALTMGVGTILDSKKALLIATGKAKADIVAKAIEGPLSAMVTASAIQMHQLAYVVLDEESASELKNTDYYRWCYDNKPERYVKF